MRNKTQADKVYEYLLENHLGRENGINCRVLAKRLCIDSRQMRAIRNEINKNPKYEKLVSTSDCCYICNTQDECQQACDTTFKTALTLFKKAWIMRKKLNRNGQTKVAKDGNGFETVEAFIEK